MKIFNAFQLVILFAAWPFIINWLYTATFPCVTAALVTAILCYGGQLVYTGVCYVYTWST